MKIVVTGSLGNVSKPLTQELVQKGHAVTVVSSNPEKKAALEAVGATAAIGTIEDVGFLTTTFTGADAVYCMLPPGGYFDPSFDIMAFTSQNAGNYVQAIEQSGVKRVVYLSTIGGHTDIGNGLLAFHHRAETILKQLPSDVGVTFMRPVGFYYNLFGFIQGIKTQGVMASNYGADDTIPWVSPIDIATAVAEELVKPLTGNNARYVASDEMTCNELAGLLGAAIGKPDLTWVLIPDEQLRSGMVSAGMNPQIATGLVEMNAAQHDGTLFVDYHRNRPVLGKVKLSDFANEFAAVYNQQ